MKTVLVNSQMVRILGFDSFGSDNYQANWIHHGLGCISAYAKREGFSIELVDLRKCKSYSDFKNNISSLQPDVVGFSMTSLDYDPVMKCIKIVKKLNKDIIVVVGGIHPTVQLDDVRKEKDIDYIIQGEGEVSFTELLRELENGRTPNRIIVGEKPDLDEIPFVDREIFDYERGELSHPFRALDAFEVPFVTVISGRGCLYNCKFCQPAERLVFGPKTRRRSVDNFMLELLELREKYNFKSLFIHDDCFTEDEDWALEFCDRYQQEGFTQPFFAQCRADIVCRKQKMIKRLAKVGLVYLSIGFESGSQRVLNFLGKGTTVEQNIEAAEICRKYDIKVGGNFMLGIPTETKTEVMQTIEMIKAINPYSTGISHFTPYPGSYLFDYCMENKIMKSTNHNIYHRGKKSKPKIKGIDYRYLRRVEDDLFQVPYIHRYVYSNKIIGKVWETKTLANIRRSLKKYRAYNKIRERLLSYK